MRKTALITGAYGGMGRACARQLGRRYDLVLADLRDEPLAAMAESLREEGYVVRATASGDLSLPGVADAIIAEAGAIGAVAHTAGLSPALADWDAILSINLIGTERLLLALERNLSEGLAAVLLASMAAHTAVRDPEIDALMASPMAHDFLARIEVHLARITEPNADLRRTAYAQSKRAVIRICGLRSGPWGARGARIASVSPGLIWTPMGRREAQSAPDTSRIVDSTPLGRWGSPVDIAAAVDFLCSDQASFITGTDLRVDGGVTPAVRGVIY